MWKPTITWIHFIERTFYDSLYAICLRMILNKDNLHCRRAYFRSSLLSLRRERETTGNTSAVRRLKQRPQNFEFPIPISFEVTTMSSVVPSPVTGNPIHPFVFPNFFPCLAHSWFQSPSFLGHVWLARRPTLSRLRLCVKLPTYHSPKATFCPKWEVSVNVGLGEGWMSSFP